MGVSSGKSRVADLAFQVFARALHPDWFLTRAHRRVVRDGWQADARIVEGGHVLHWACGPIRLTEILGDSRALLPERGLLYHSPVKQERSASLRASSGRFAASSRSRKLCATDSFGSVSPSSRWITFSCSRR